MRNITISTFFISILILALLILNGLLLFNLKKCKKNLSNDRKQNNITVENIFIQNKILEDYYIEQIKYDYIKLNNISLSNNDVVIELEELLNNETGLVFFAPENACSPCYDGILDQFSFISESIGEDRFIVIVPETKFREFAAYFKKKDYKISLYCLKTLDEMPKISDGELPYFCLVSPDLVAKHFFIPNKNGISYFINYINVISEKYFNNKK